MPNVLWTLPHSKGLTEKKIICKQTAPIFLLFCLILQENTRSDEETKGYCLSQFKREFS